jgi:hypothetical protein
MNYLEKNYLEEVLLATVYYPKKYGDTVVVP